MWKISQTQFWNENFVSVSKFFGGQLMKFSKVFCNEKFLDCYFFESIEFPNLIPRSLFLKKLAFKLIFQIFYLQKAFEGVLFEARIGLTKSGQNRKFIWYDVHKELSFVIRVFVNNPSRKEFLKSQRKDMRDRLK